MKIEDIYKAAVALKALLIARGYTSGDVRIGFHYIGYQMVIVVEASTSKSTIIPGPATEEGLQEAILKAEEWIHSIPDAAQQAKVDFLKQIPHIISQAEAYGIKLPLELGA